MSEKRAGRAEAGEKKVSPKRVSRAKAGEKEVSPKRVSRAKAGEKKISPKKVVIYSTPTCPICKMAKQYFSKKGIPYREVNVAADKEAAHEMIHISGQMGVPVILVDDKVMVGFNQVELDKLLAKSD